MIHHLIHQGKTEESLDARAFLGGLHRIILQVYVVAPQCSGNNHPSFQPQALSSRRL